MQVEAAMDDALPLFLQTAWSYVVQDIDRTVQDGWFLEGQRKKTGSYCLFVSVDSRAMDGDG